MSAESFERRMGHGDGEKMYDWCVLLGLNPVPWQFDLLQQMEQQAIDETFRDIINPT